VSEVAAERRVEVVRPDGLPDLDGTAWRALLRLLVDAAERELGPGWRLVLAQGAGESAE